MSDVNGKITAGSSAMPKDRNAADPWTTNQKKKRRNWDARKRRRGKPAQDQKPKRGLQPPNYFFAVKIDEPKIKGVMQAIQDHLVDQNELLQHVVVSNKLAHLTVGLLHLPDQESVAKAVSMMEACKEKIQDIVSNQSFTLHVDGLGHFNQQVLFAKVYPDENEDLLRRIAEFLSQEFLEFKSSSPFKYTPHLTLMKLSKIQRSYHLKKKIRRIDKTLFEHIMDIHFGHQKVTSLQLLCMARKEKDGYYFCEREVSFGSMEDAMGKIVEEKYAQYLSSHILTSATCVSSKEKFTKEFKDISIGDTAEATVNSAMNTALEEVLMRNNKPSA